MFFCNVLSQAQLASFLCRMFLKKWSWIVIYSVQIQNYKIEVQLKPKLHQLWGISLWLSKLQLSVFLKIVWVFWLVGRICPLMQAHFLWPLLKRKAFLLRLNKGSNFLQRAFWIWITKRFSLVRECNVFLQCCITLCPARQFSLQNVRLSRIVTYRSKIIRVNCSLNWSYRK